MMILKEVSCWSTCNNFNCRLWRGLRIRADQVIAGGEEITSEISSDAENANHDKDKGVQTASTSASPSPDHHKG